jgi:hypothetical protein
MISRGSIGAIGPMIVSFLLLSCVFSVLVPGAGAAVIKTLTGGADKADVQFDTAGKDTSLSLSVPKQSLIASASLDLEGVGLQSGTPVMVDYDFNDSTNNKAWWGASNTQAAGDPTNYIANAFVLGDYPNIAKSDDLYKDTTNIPNQYAYHHFSFLVTSSGITSIKVVWEGGGVANNMIGNGGAVVFIYNNATSQWEEVGNFACGDVWCEQTITKSFATNPGGYPDDAGKVHVLAVTRSAGVTNRITTDFVKIVVGGTPILFPKDPSLDVGNDGDNEWTYSGNFATNTTITGAVLVNELNALIAAAGQGPGNAIVPLALSSSSPGILRISNISIVIDEPPELLGEIPSNWSLKEDTDAPNLIDLYDYFDDDLDTKLTFSIFNKSAPQLLEATIGNSGKMSFTTPTENWWGVATFIVKATDSKGQAMLSNRFNVSVESVNDAPVLEPIGPKSVKQGGSLHFTIKATDVDKALNPNEYVRYSSDNKLVVANAITGEISVVDVDPQTPVGSVIPVNFTATDSMGTPDVEFVNISIEDEEFAPVLGHIGNKTLREDQRFTFQILASDPDKAESLTFSSEGALFNVSAEGKIDFVPLQKDVGNHTMVLKVTDGHNWTTETVVFKVLNVNDAPILSAIPDQNADNRHAFVYLVSAKDEDIGFDPLEKLTFSSECEVFTIDPGTGEIRFTPTVAMAGTHKCSIEVSDAQGLSANATMNITVKVVNSPPKIDTITIDVKTPVKSGSKVILLGKATDPDNDPLTYQWFKDKDLSTPVGTNKTLEIKAPKSGKVTYTLVVSDGITKTNNTVTIPVKKEAKGLLPGFELIPSVFALALLSAVIVMRRKKT